MELKWRTVTGSQEQKPEAIDKTSSSEVVYLRRNIERTYKTEEKGGVVLLWQYEEAVVTQEEYAQYDTVVMEVVQAAVQEAVQEAVSGLAAEQEEKIATVRADMEYIAMMQNIDLEG